MCNKWWHKGDVDLQMISEFTIIGQFNKNEQTKQTIQRIAPFHLNQQSVKMRIDMVLQADCIVLLA